jgi:hypothetical protein
VAYGLLNGCLNILPTVVPQLLTTNESYSSQCFVLAVLAGLASFFAYLAARIAKSWALHYPEWYA